MSFQIHALPMAPFARYFEMSAAELAANAARRVTAETAPGYPCRVSLADAEIGETLLLVNHVHLDAATPYRGSHAIYVREHAVQAFPTPGEVPAVLATRLISLRAFDEDHLMRCAEVAQGPELASLLDDMLNDPGTAFVDLHNAKQGCFAARATGA